MKMKINNRKLDSSSSGADGKDAGAGPRSRFRPAPAAGLTLTARDEALLTALFLNRVMTRGQIQALFFSSVPRCNARLRQLFDWGYLSRAYLPTAPFGSQALYSAGRAALSVIGKALDRMGLSAEGADVTAHCRRPALSLLEHALATGDVYLAVQKALAACPGVRLEHWLPERFCCHEFEIRRTDAAGGASRWRKQIFRPDAFLRLVCSEDARNCFLEVDRGHTSSRQFLGKIRTHGRFHQSGLFAEVFGWDDFQTLVVTTGDRRADNLRALAERERDGLFRFTTFALAEREGFLAPIWRTPFQEDARGLFDGEQAEPWRA